MADTGKSKHSRSHARRAGEDLGKAAEAFADKLLPPETMEHIREAARHLLRAGIAALDNADRRSRERHGGKKTKDDD